MSAIRTTIAGVPIPDSALAQEATEFDPHASSSDLLYYRSRPGLLLRPCLQGATLRASDYDRELLYVGAMFHDIGLVEGHRSAHDRFEVDGANAAREFLAGHGVSGDARVRDRLGRDRAPHHSGHPAATRSPRWRW